MTLLDRSAALRAVCALDCLVPERGVAALLDDVPVAVFRLWSGAVVAIDNIDPVTGASVLSRGIVGDAGGVPTVASPLYKQRYDLRTGRCLDDEHARVRVHDVRVIDGVVHVALQP